MHFLARFKFNLIWNKGYFTFPFLSHVFLDVDNYYLTSENTKEFFMYNKR